MQHRLCHITTRQVFRRCACGQHAQQQEHLLNAYIAHTLHTRMSKNTPEQCRLHRHTRCVSIQAQTSSLCAKLSERVQGALGGEHRLVHKMSAH